MWEICNRSGTHGGMSFEHSQVSSFLCPWSRWEKGREWLCMGLQRGWQSSVQHWLSLIQMQAWLLRLPSVCPEILVFRPNIQWKEHKGAGPWALGDCILWVLWGPNRSTASFLLLLTFIRKHRPPGPPVSHTIQPRSHSDIRYVGTAFLIHKACPPLILMTAQLGGKASTQVLGGWAGNLTEKSRLSNSGLRTASPLTCPLHTTAGRLRQFSTPLSPAFSTPSHLLPSSQVAA